jgi:uncharacterized protein
MNLLNTLPTLNAPKVLPEAAPFWQATAQGKLLLKRCTDCDKVHFYPRDVCPHCMSLATEWIPASGKGVIYSYSTMKRPGASDQTYTLAFITLEEGVTIMSNLVNCDLSALAIGAKVSVLFAPSKTREGEAGAPVPVFTLE